jgi:threonine synthase
LFKYLLNTDRGLFSIREPLSFSCTDCNKVYKLASIEYKCSECGGLLWYKPEITEVKNKFLNLESKNSFWDYSFTFPYINPDFRVTLGEGGTDCRSSKKIGSNWGVKNLYFKDETQNPTNSFKDRAAALLISHARSWDFHKIICASNGNQGASISAYTSLEGMKCVNIIPKEIDVGKKAQMIAYNSEIKEIGITVDESINYILKQKNLKEYYQCTPELNPLTIEAQKTISYEIVNQIKNLDWIIIPMGSGGTLVSLWKGFLELNKCGIIKKIPKLVGVQSQLCSPIVNEFEGKSELTRKKDEFLKSYALGILVKNPIYLKLAIKAIRESNGIALSIPENLVLTSAEKLARNEGIFAEPASALTIAALNTLVQREVVNIDDTVVCLITGSGLKAPYVLEAISSRAKTVGMGILSTKLKILTQISLSSTKGIYGSKLKEILGTVSLPAIYQHLKDLEQKELIKRYKSGKNVYYTITEKGKKVLEALDILITLF